MSTEDSHAHGLPFTDAARQLLADARTESVRLQHEYVGAEHVVLALTCQPDDTAILARLGIDREQVRALIDATITPGHAVPATGIKRPYTSRTERIFSLAAESARTFGHGRVGVEHLIVGMLSKGKGVGAEVLQHFGLTAGQAFEQVRRLDTDGSTS
jgi:ATP-dependent Clp protease ATP-binding subunit ClpC